MPNGLFTLKQVDLAISQGAWTNQPPNAVNYLVLAGGGGGGRNWGGGGGAGGLLQGSIPITAGTSYTVTVGAGGSGGSNDITNNATSGGNSVFGSITATGGGFGGMYNFQNAASGGSGGGGGSGSNPGNLGQGTANQGNAGGAGDNGGANSCAGGGGGAGTRGLAATSATAGNGGAGVASDISGARTTYAGGGGGASNSGGTAGTGGAGGGGNGGKYGTSAPTSAGGNTGGGGGGAQYLEYSGGNGGSGVVIVSYPGTTQWFTGGTLSYGNGNIVHSFYSSGTLAPTTPSQYVDTGYQISRSLRFNSADSTYLNRTPASAGNLRAWTWSVWIKRTLNDANPTEIFSTPTGEIFFNTNNTLAWYDNSGYYLITTQVFRDPSSWYHLVFVWDTASATPSNRVKIYVNGVQITAFTTETYPAQNTTSTFNLGIAHNIGRYTGGSQYINAYMTEVNFIDGQALTPQSFGYYNPDTGVWSPLKFVGTYGTNGFYLNFSDNSNTTAATLGKDYSGNGNNWTPNNFSVSAGVGNDSLVDTPTPYGSDTGAGGTVRGNYATWNPVDIRGTGNVMLSLANGNLQATGISGGWRTSKSTIGMSSGKWYCEATLTSISGTLYARLGLANSAAPTDNYLGFDSNGWPFTGSWSVNDVIGIAFDADAGTLAFYLNNSLQGTSYSGLTSGPYFFAISIFDPTVLYVNFGQRPFAYTAPSGFKALCTQNLPTPTIGATTATQAGKYFNPVLYTGTGSSLGVTGVGFQPDWVWIKERNAAADHGLYDAVRGVQKQLESNTTDAETTETTGLTAFNSDGFTVGALAQLNTNNDTYVAWNWKANGAGVTNTAGSITSTVSANTTSGFSVVTYTGNGNNATVGHGLGAAPKMIILKSRSNALGWSVYHASLGATQELVLNSSAAAATSIYYWANTEPTSTVFSLFGGGANNNSSGYTYVAYCFAAVPGYSAFGSYTGNGSTDGPFIFTGFRPAYVLFKRADSANQWFVQDARRNPYNVADLSLSPNRSIAEETGKNFDILSNGFKLRQADVGWNASGGTYIYAAFAEFPFKYSPAR